MSNAVRIKELNDKITALEKENTTLKETIAYLTRKDVYKRQGIRKVLLKA